MPNSKIKGFCRDCDHRRQEPVVVECEDGVETIVIDKYCSYYDVFKREYGYCDWFVKRKNYGC